MPIGVYAYYSRFSKKVNPPPDSVILIISSIYGINTISEKLAVLDETCSASAGCFVLVSPQSIFRPVESVFGNL
jgi:hypothetical protein